jgi:hypothetical protein
MSFETFLSFYLMSNNLNYDSYYSYQAFVDYGFPDIFISRETFGWNPQEAKLHMVPDYFSASEVRKML